jgi:hypothetical protein
LKLVLALAFILVVLLSGASGGQHGLIRSLTDNYYFQLSG